jgi:DNA replication protein DnaC
MTTRRDKATGHVEARPRIMEMLKALCLPGMRAAYAECIQTATREDLGHEAFLGMLLEREREAREARRIERLMAQSRLPHGKTFATFDRRRLPHATLRIAEALGDGGFLDRRENVLVFGNPGSGKTHLVCAIAEEQVHKGRSVHFTTCSLLVQHLLAAKRDLALPGALKKLARYEALVIDDIGYVQHSRDEMEVLFTLLADRYERGSVLLTTNLPFSQWERIFKDPMVTAAAVDRLVHHSVIIELNMESYRMAAAKKARRPNQTKPEPTKEDTP